MYPLELIFTRPKGLRLNFVIDETRSYVCSPVFGGIYRQDEHWYADLKAYITLLLTRYRKC